MNYVSFKNAIYKMGSAIIYLMNMHKKESALNNL